MSNIPDRRSGWRLDKTINIPIMLTVAGLAFSVFLWGSGVNTDIQMLKLQDANQKATQVTMIQSINKLADDSKQDMREIRQVLFAVKDQITKKK